MLRQGGRTIKSVGKKKRKKRAKRRKKKPERSTRLPADIEEVVAGIVQKMADKKWGPQIPVAGQRSGGGAGCNAA